MKYRIYDCLRCSRPADWLSGYCEKCIKGNGNG